MAMTRDEIILSALRKAGNTSLVMNAREWLNNLLDRLYDEYKFSFLEKTEDGTLSSGQTSVNLPSDFLDLWNRRGLRLEDPTTGATNPLTLLVPDQFDEIVNPSLSGEPSHAIVDLADESWRPYPVANRGFTYHLRYKYTPGRLTGNTVPLFPNDKILVQGVFAEALDYAADERAKPEYVVLQKMIDRYTGRFNRSPNRGGVVLLSPSVFKRVQSYR